MEGVECGGAVVPICSGWVRSVGGQAQAMWERVQCVSALCKPRSSRWGHHLVDLVGMQVADEEPVPGLHVQERWVFVTQLGARSPANIIHVTTVNTKGTRWVTSDQ